MKFGEFKENVEKWATVRGIYDQSTEAHQQAKALEKLGRYLTADSSYERMDAIGDIAVCIVNAAKIINSKWLAYNPLIMRIYDELCFDVGLSKVASAIIDQKYFKAINYLRMFAINNSFEFEKCLNQAWNEIKDRKGMMVDGKYVKWDNLSNDEKAEFMERGKWKN